MPLPDVLLLALCVGIGGVCAAADCRVKRVPNRILLIGCLAAAILQAVRLCFFPSEQALPWLFSMIAADVMAVLLYAGHLWGAGDSKLFAFSYLCFPISLLSDSTLTNSFLPYIFIFLPAFFWTVVDSIHQAILRKEKFHMPHDWRAELKGYVWVLLEVVAFQHLSTLISPDFFAQNPLVHAAISMIYAYLCSTSGFFKRPICIAVHGAALVVAMCLFPVQFSFASVNWWIYLLVPAILLLQSWSAQYNYERIPTSSVQAGQILSAGTVLQFLPSRIQNLPRNTAEDMSARLSAAEAEAVRRWGNSRQGKADVVIVRKIPFAPLIALGFAVFYLFQLVR